MRQKMTFLPIGLHLLFGKVYASLCAMAPMRSTASVSLLISSRRKSGYARLW